MTNSFIFKHHPKFPKEKRKMIAKCPSLKEDFETFKNALCTDIIYNNFDVPTNNNKYFQISGLSKNVTLPVFIVKKFRCQDINKGSDSGFRLTFVYDKKERLIYFVEFYHKNKKKIEDKNRINNLF